MTTIAHAAARTDEDLVPFEHGVALARRSGGSLVSVHAVLGGEGPTTPLDAGAVLARWGDPQGRVDAQSLLHDCCDDPVDTLLDALRRLEPDLVIAGTHQRKGLTRALVGSRAESIAHNVSVPTLLIPVGVDGFVSRGDGGIDLRRILVPIGDDEEAKAALEAAVALGELAKVEGAELVLLRVGAAADAPDVTVPDVPGWNVRRVDVVGKSPEDAILEHAESACVVVMATRGHDSLGDVVRGSHTERVLHRAHCPVLSVPVETER